jgi:hypothetical protein
MANNLTADGRARGAAALKAAREGWPKPTATWGKALGTRRFDEPGMEVKFKGR